MSDLVGNPEDRFSHNEAHIIPVLGAGLVLHISLLVMNRLKQAKSAIFFSFGVFPAFKGSSFRTHFSSLRLMLCRVAVLKSLFVYHGIIAFNFTLKIEHCLK